MAIKNSNRVRIKMEKCIKGAIISISNKNEIFSENILISMQKYTKDLST
jgi:hypothetical protein